MPTSPGPHVSPMITSPGPYVALMLTIPCAPWDPWMAAPPLPPGPPLPLAGGLAGGEVGSALAAIDAKLGEVMANQRVLASLGTQNSGACIRMYAYARTHAHIRVAYAVAYVCGYVRVCTHAHSLPYSASLGTQASASLDAVLPNPHPHHHHHHHHYPHPKPTPTQTQTSASLDAVLEVSESAKTDAMLQRLSARLDAMESAQTQVSSTSTSPSS